jgi:hypothetical protein
MTQWFLQITDDINITPVLQVCPEEVKQEMEAYIFSIQLPLIQRYLREGKCRLIWNTHPLPSTMHTSEMRGPYPVYYPKGKIEGLYDNAVDEHLSRQ